MEVIVGVWVVKLPSVKSVATAAAALNVVFDNGIETRIAKDAEGIAEGGFLLNEIQTHLKQ